MALVTIKLAVNSKGAKSELSGFQKSLGGLKKVAKVTGGALAAIGGVALKKGWDRLNAIDQATAKLKGLGHSGDSIKGIMNSALESVKGTSYGLGDAATAAASAIAAGIKPGKQLTDYLKMIGNGAALSGRSFNEFGAIVNKVNANTKLSMGEVNQIQDAGIPILQKLAESYGVSTQEMSKMVSAGEVSAAKFNEVLTGTVGNAAVEMGNTVSGSWANMNAALGRVGANLLSGIFPKLAGGFQGITAALGPIEAGATGVGLAIGAGLDLAISAVQDLWSHLQQVDFTPLTDAAGRLFSALQAALPRVVEGVSSLGRTFGPLLGQIAKFAATAVFTAVVVAIDALAIAVDAVASGFSSAAGFIERNKTLLGGIATVIGAALLPGLIATTANVIATNAAWLVYGLTVKGITIATTAWSVAQRILNTVLRANPIGIVITVLAALVAGIIYAYKNSETFRTIVHAAFEGVKVAGKALWTALKAAFNGIVAAIKWAYNLVKSYVNLYIAGFKLLVSGGKSAWNGVKSAFQGVVNAVNWAKNLVVAYCRNVVQGWQTIINGARQVIGGVRNAFNNVVSFVAGIPGRILSAIGNLGSLLYNAGASVINGFVDGIKGAAGKVKSALGGITNKLTSWKGPPSTDKRILTPAGRMIIQGLIAGIQAERGALKKELANVTGMIGGTEAQMGFSAGISAAGSGTGRGNTYNITVEVPVSASKADVGREIMDAIKAYERVGGRK